MANHGCIESELDHERSSDELFSDDDDEDTQEASGIDEAETAGSGAATSRQVAENVTLSAIKNLLEQIAKKVERNEASIQELKEQFTRFGIYMIGLSNQLNFFHRTPVHESPQSCTANYSGCSASSSTPKRPIKKPLRVIHSLNTFSCLLTKSQ